MRARSIVLVLPLLLACSRHRVAVPSFAYPIEGAYSFSIKRNNGDIYSTMDGRFVIADTQVFLYVDVPCELAQAPQTSDGSRFTWFDCNRSRDGAVFQLRISHTDPVNKSLWYSRSRELNTVSRCIIYDTSGNCTRWGRARGMEWVDRYGPINVTRGLPPLEPRDERKPQPMGNPRSLRVRCDTTSVSSRSCGNR